MKKTIKDQVVESRELLSTMKSHKELREWAIAMGFDNRSAFPKFKDALAEIGMNYDAIKHGVFKAQEAAIEAVVEAGGKLSLEQLAAKIGGKLWMKGDKIRIYVNAGYNTNKMKTSAYIWFSQNDCGAAVYVECPSQPYSWCAAQAEQVKDSLSGDVDVCRELYNGFETIEA